MQPSNNDYSDLYFVRNSIPRIDIRFFQIFLFLQYFKRLLQKLQHNTKERKNKYKNKLHKSSKVKCRHSDQRSLGFRVGHCYMQLNGVDIYKQTHHVVINMGYEKGYESSACTFARFRSTFAPLEGVKMISNIQFIGSHACGDIMDRHAQQIED